MSRRFDIDPIHFCDTYKADAPDFPFCYQSNNQISHQFSTNFIFFSYFKISSITVTRVA